MNREIKYRGYCGISKEWKYGFLVIDPIGTYRIYWRPFIGATSNTWHYVSQSSVGQYTGRPDIKGTCIYEGYIVRQKLEDSVEPNGFFNCDSVVEMVEGCWVLSQVGFDYSKTPFSERCLLRQADDIEVIGNIYEKEVPNG